jgi:hypothetical protein
MKRSVWTMAAAATLLGALAQARAGTISWGTPTTLSGDTDVITAGTLVGAFNLGPSGVPTTTVNGVTFIGMPFPPASSGNFTFTVLGTGNFGNSGPVAPNPPPVLSSSYQALVSYEGGTSSVLDGLSLAMSGLQAGDLYQFEWWLNDGQGGNFHVTASAGNSVTLLSNLSLGNAGPGQYAVGSFTADGTGNQVITFHGDAKGAILDGFELRDVSVATPEPDGLTLFGIAAISMMTYALRRRKTFRH